MNNFLRQLNKYLSNGAPKKEAASVVSVQDFLKRYGIDQEAIKVYVVDCPVECSIPAASTSRHKS
ncbi:MAG: hypothetical protein AAF959_09565 [Cyanobacteria bacterium P01_D01_bin.56]